MSEAMTIGDYYDERIPEYDQQDCAGCEETCNEYDMVKIDGEWWCSRECYDEINPPEDDDDKTV